MAEKPYTNREEAKEYALKILSDLTPGGSEFFEAPVACAHYICKTRDDLRDILKREILRRKKLRRETREECALILEGHAKAFTGVDASVAGTLYAAAREIRDLEEDQS